MKPKIAFLTGGYSGEAEVSYKSAVTIEANLDRQKFDVYKIDITPQGWFYVNENDRIAVDKNEFTVSLPQGKIRFDAVFIGIHGTPGEDGKLQGYFDMLHIPYTTCDTTTSALTFNKRFTVAVAHMTGVPVARSIHLFKHLPMSAGEVASQVKFPVFVKPNNGGSSIGMSKVDEAGVLGAAIEKAFKEDDQVLIEEMIAGREFTVGVYRSKNDIVVLPITEVRANAEMPFFDFEAKYHGKSTETTPAIIDDIMEEHLREMAKKIYLLFNCRGVVRIDMIYNEAEAKPYMLEINTVPGQSAASIIPQQVRAKGMDLKDFYSELIETCLM